MVMKDCDSESTENPRFGCRSWILGHDSCRFGWRMDVHWQRNVSIQDGRLNTEPWRPHAVYESRFKRKGHLVKESEEEQSAEDSCVFLASEKLKEALQWPFNNMGLNYVDPLIQGYFPVGNTTILHSLWLAESLDVEEPRYQSPVVNHTQAEPYIVQESTVYWNVLALLTIR